MRNQSYNTQKFKRVIMHHQDFSLQNVETQAYTFMTYDRRHYINIGDGYAIIRPKDISNYQYIHVIYNDMSSNIWYYMETLCDK